MVKWEKELKNNKEAGTHGRKAGSKVKSILKKKNNIYKKYVNKSKVTVNIMYLARY